ASLQQARRVDFMRCRAVHSLQSCSFGRRSRNGIEFPLCGFFGGGVGGGFGVGGGGEDEVGFREAADEVARIFVDHPGQAFAIVLGEAVERLGEGGVRGDGGNVLVAEV